VPATDPICGRHVSRILDLVVLKIKRIFVENQFLKEENTHNAQQNMKTNKTK
jgi:hypothetical protein